MPRTPVDIAAGARERRRRRLCKGGSGAAALFRPRPATGYAARVHPQIERPSPTVSIVFLRAMGEMCCSPTARACGLLQTNSVAGDPPRWHMRGHSRRGHMLDGRCQRPASAQVEPVRQQQSDVSAEADPPSPSLPSRHFAIQVWEVPGKADALD